MKRYIRAVICIIFSFIKFCFIKIFHIKQFKFTFFNLVSPFTEIEINKKANLTLGKMIKIRSGSKVKVRNGAVIHIGDYTSLNYGCMIIGHERIIIGKNVQFGPNVLIYDHDHDFRQKDGLKKLKYKSSPVIIGDNVWIGANVVILRGSKIGNNCIIGAGSIIKGEYDDNNIIVQKRETTENKIVSDI